jgi:PAS domain S-box-containing protein
MTTLPWKDLFRVAGRARWVFAIAAVGYVVLAAVSIVFFVQLQRAETQMRDFLGTDDHTMFSRTGFEYERAIRVLLRATGGSTPVSIDKVRQPIDILYNRLSVFRDGTEATRFVQGLPEYGRLVAALEHSLAAADGILKAESGPTLSAEGGARLLTALDTLRPPLEAAIGAVIVSSAAKRDALQSDLEQVRTLMFASVIAFVSGSVLFVGYLGYSNRQIARQNRELKAATAQLERSEARLNAFMHNAPTVMTILDPECRFEIVNPRTERFYGRSAAELVGRRGCEIRTLSGEPELEALKLAVIETGAAQSGQVRHVTPHGEVWKYHVAFPIHDAARSVEAVGLIGLDITEMIRQRERAEEASQAKSRMLANASHELRTPLNAIIGFSQVIENEMFGPVGLPAYKDYAGDIVRSGEHLVGVIDAILDLSRVESGQSGLIAARANPNEIAATAVTLVQGAAMKGGLALDVRRDDALPDIIVDSGKLTQVLVNLLSNAIKFTKYGGRVSMTCSADPTDGIAFVVTDSGIGIDAADLPQVVLPFIRGGSALERKHEGTGLGLAIAKALAEQHDGTLQIESQRGAGTKVTVRLPASRIAPSLPESESESRTA